jgi:hypothetical protein
MWPALDYCVAVWLTGLMRVLALAFAIRPKRAGLFPTYLPRCHNSERAATAGVGLVRDRVGSSHAAPALAPPGLPAVLDQGL